MKTKALNLILVISLITSSVTISCSSDANNQTNNNQTQITNNVQSGTWRITNFNDSGVDETDHFTGYSFTFAANAVLTATNGVNTFVGTWNITDSNSGDDSIDDLHFNINFNLTNDFEELNEDWNIVSQSATKIELIHISGGSGGTDFLTFEKN